jgi:hypothetical protein
VTLDETHITRLRAVSPSYAMAVIANENKAAKITMAIKR